MADKNATTLFEKFDIIECLKKDAGAAVYLANHIYLGKRILLKTLDRDNIPDPAMLSRFQREAKTLAKLEHPNIIKVLDFGTHAQFFYISFEYFDSRNLRDVIKAGDLSDVEKKHVLVQLFRGLDYAHQRHVIHRDIKPENILLNEHKTLKIADFGLAQVHGEESFTLQTTIVGTPSYMSPEQIRGDELTAQSDLFSAGVLVYELMTGENPFLGQDVGATLNNIFTKNVQLEKAGIDETTYPLIYQLLQKNKNERLKSAQQALEILGEQTTEPTRPAQSTIIHKPPRYFVVGAVAILALIFISIWIIFGPKQSAITNIEFDEPDNIVDTTTTVIKAQPDNGLKPIEKDSIATTPTLDTQPFIAERQENLNTTPQKPGRLYLDCQPWAHVYINNNKINTTPLEEALLLQPGFYTVRLEHPNYPEHVQNIRIESEKDYYINVTLYSYLSCDTFPWGNVFLNSDTLGQTPVSEAIIAPGKHLLTIKNPQYGEVEKSFVIAPGDTFYFMYNFEQQAEF